MARTPHDPSAPVRRSVVVSWDQDAAYRRFTDDFATWWPSYSLSIGGKRVKRVVFERRVGGQIYEEHADGTRFLWGKVTVLDAPHRVAFTWHSSRDESDAQLVVVSFRAEGAGTRVELVATGWEKMSRDALRARGGYQMSWGAALDTFADRSSATRLLFNVMSTVIDLMGQRQTFIRNSRSRMSRT